MREVFLYLYPIKEYASMFYLMVTIYMINGMLNFKNLIFLKNLLILRLL